MKRMELSNCQEGGVPLVAGIDIGAATAKAVILKDREICSFAIVPTGADIVAVSWRVINLALKKGQLQMDDLQLIMTTGSGRNLVPFANGSMTEILCHAKGASFAAPQTRTVIDIGGQDSKVIRVDDSSNVVDFVMNDKCAAGTGRFLEVMARVLQCKINEMGSIALKSKGPCPISSICTVFAETEVVSLRAQGKSREDLVAGIHQAAAFRIAAMGERVGYREQLILTGGVAKNVCMKDFLQQRVGMEILVPKEPQIMGALGAALFAKEKATPGVF
jgi:predicted CoA-substrate-specific enzyme activase